MSVAATVLSEAGDALVEALGAVTVALDGADGWARAASMSVSVIGGVIAAELLAGMSFGVFSAQRVSHVHDGWQWQRLV